MLSFKKGKMIARIQGGKYDGKTLYLDNPNSDSVCCNNCVPDCTKKKKKCCEKCNMVGGICSGGSNDKEIIKLDDDNGIEPDDPIKYVTDLFIRMSSTGKGKAKNKLTTLDIERLKRALLNKQEPLEDNLTGIYNESKEILEDKQKNDLYLDVGKMIPLPNRDNWQVIYAGAPSDSGKSYLCSTIIQEFQKMFPERDFFVFSKVDSDEVIDKLNPKRIKINQEIIDDPIQPEELANSIILLDDIDATNDGKLKKAITGIRDALIEHGRHHKVIILCTAHQLMNYKESRNLLNEATVVFIFPTQTPYHSKEYLKKYVGLDKKDIKNIMDLPSRWVGIYKTYPRLVLHEHGAFLLTKK